MVLPRAMITAGEPGENPTICCLPVASSLPVLEVSFQKQLGRRRTLGSLNSAQGPQGLT